MLLYFVRHGETDWNVQRRLSGEYDIPLNENGIRLSRETARGLKDVVFDLAIVSPLIRAQETARIILGDRNVPVMIDPHIQEIKWGDWDGWSNTGKENAQIHQEMEYFYHEPMKFHGAPNGESIRDLCKRGTEFYHALITNPDYQDKTILIATHGCAVRGILNCLYENPEDFWHGSVPTNCAVNIIEVKNGISRFLAEDKIYYDESLKTDYYVMDEE